MKLIEFVSTVCLPNFSLCILLIFKNDENIVFEEVKDEHFNSTTLKILDIIINKKMYLRRNIKVYKNLIYDSLISSIEISDENMIKIHLHMEKALFFKISRNFDLVYDIHEIMQLIHSKIYLYINYSKKITGKLFYLLYTNKSSLINIYQAYDEYMKSDSRQKMNFIHEDDLQSTKYKNNQYLVEFLQGFTSDQTDSEDEKFSPDTKYSIRCSMSSFEQFMSILDSTKQNFNMNNLMYSEEHPFYEHINIFCNLVCLNFKFTFVNRDNILLLTMSIIHKKKSKNFICLPASVFLDLAESLKNNTEYEIKMSKNESSEIDSSAQLSKYSFLEHFRQKLFYPFINLECNLSENVKFLDIFTTFIHPKKVFLNITSSYLYLYSFDCEAQNELSVQQLCELIQMILNKIYFIKLQIDSFCIDITKSRIFDITNAKILTNACFTPCLYTSVRCMKKNASNLLGLISSNHLYAYTSQKKKSFQFYEYENENLNLTFDFGRIVVNDIYIVHSIYENNIQYIHVIIERKNCLLEIQKYNSYRTRKKTSFQGITKICMLRI